MARIFFNREEFVNVDSGNYVHISSALQEKTGLSAEEFYLVQNGKVISSTCDTVSGNLQCILRLAGGKGGFGSMLRAIGAQIEKTTNREACRDLSGRRLRDINEEKRLKTWLEKQSERDREAEERKKRKIEKLLAIPKHEFRDEQYEEARAKLTDKVNDAVEQGFKNDPAVKGADETAENKSLKRKCTTSDAAKAKKKRALWIDENISDTDSSDSGDSSDADPAQPEAENLLTATKGENEDKS